MYIWFYLYMGFEPLSSILFRALFEAMQQNHFCASIHKTSEYLGPLWIVLYAFLKYIRAGFIRALDNLLQPSDRHFPGWQSAGWHLFLIVSYGESAQLNICSNDSRNRPYILAPSSSQSQSFFKLCGTAFRHCSFHRWLRLTSVVRDDGFHHLLPSITNAISPKIYSTRGSQEVHLNGV